MTIQPTIQFSFVPTCNTFKCCCCCWSDESEVENIYPTKSGKFKPVPYMTDKEVIKADKRFREIILRKIDPLPLDNEEFLDRLENEEGISLRVTRENPLTKERLDRTIKAINKILSHMKIT